MKHKETTLAKNRDNALSQATLMPCLLELMKISVRVNKNARSADISRHVVRLELLLKVTL